MVEPDPFHEGGFDLMTKLMEKYFDFQQKESNSSNNERVIKETDDHEEDGDNGSDSD